MEITKRFVLIYLSANLLSLGLMLSYIILIFEGVAHNSAIVGAISGAIAGADAICFYILFLRKSDPNQEEWRN